MHSEIIASLFRVLEAEPQNIALREHLAEMLVAAGRHEEALEQCLHVLAAKPDSVACLGYAAASAEALGQPERAASYRRLHAAMSGAKADTPVIKLPAEDEGVVKMLADSARSQESGTPLAEEPTRITLADVAGMDAVKRRLEMSFLGPLRNPELMRMYGKSVRGGLMLYGPPGCGKTFLARAVAGELGARFLSVGIAEVLDMYLGQSEKNLQSIFEAAREAAPCVLFFDEIDALGRKRSLRRESAGRDLVNLLLAELDGVQQKNAGVFVLAATNHPWDVDSALRRPGRLDRMLLVLPPDQNARLALLQHAMGQRPQEGLDLAAIAAKTDRYSGADVVHLVESATEHALEESMTTGKPRPIRQDDFKRALKEVKPSTNAWFETARNYALFANDGGAYDELLEYLKANKIV